VRVEVICVGDLEMLRGQAVSHVFSQHNTLRDGRTFGFALDLLLQKVFFFFIHWCVSLTVKAKVHG